jgi:hypothetical protein
MTKQEKIFFKRYSTLSGKKNLSYLQLFDALDKMPQYDINKLNRKLKGASFLHRLARMKNSFETGDFGMFVCLSRFGTQER